MDMITKYITAEKSETVDAERSVIGWGSKPLPDRDGELIEASAWDLENYRKTPVLCLSHDLSKPPIGKILWIKADPNGLKFKAQFASTERGKEVYQLYKEGIMNAFSVGFRPKAGGFVDNPMDEKYKGMGLKRLFKAVELFEVSCVTVPALPSAVAEYVKSGKIQDSSLKEEFEELISKAVVEEEEVKGDTVESKEEIVENAEHKEEIDNTKDEPPEYVKTLMTTMQKMQEKIESMEKEKMLKEEESKTLDSITGQPSVYDIMSALNNVYQNRKTVLPGEPDVNGANPSMETNRPYVYVVDIYPTAYPDGFVVFRVSVWENGSNINRSFRQGYTYDATEKIATLTDDAIAVQGAWVEKKYDPEFLTSHTEELEEEEVKGEDEEDLETKSEDEDDLETKSGRVLSGANRAKLEDLQDQLSDISDTIQEILDSADSNMSEEDEEKGAGDEEVKDEEDLETKGADSKKEDDEIFIDEDEADDHTKGDDTQQIENLEDDIQIDAKELSDILSKSLASAVTELRTNLKDKTAEETHKLLGKATLG